MSLYEKLIAKEAVLAVVGLGYVGMPIAVAFAKKGLNVIGFDTNSKKIEAYCSGADPTKEVGDEQVRNTTVQFTDEEQQLRKADFIVVAVPTPVNFDHTPDLTPVIGASEIVGRNLKKGAIVVYESTVYPGCTENVCIPILEKGSGMVCGTDFKIGYSPERINPGDKAHRLENIRKIVSGMDEESLEEIQHIYDIVIEVGTYPVSNIRTAEAIKVVENSQRDINIAFMNELAMVFDRMDIDTNEVVDGMNTKWNALGFRPGLVGGHCIGVDPYYFTYEAEKLGYHSQIILNGRILNDNMGAYIADKAVKQMILAGQTPKAAKVVVLGLTFKEGCPDIRNTKDMGTPERYAAVCEDVRSGHAAARNLRRKQKAVFLDRDGTINRYVGFLRNIDEFELLPGVAQAVRKINELGWLAVVVTNQPVIARGEVTEEQLEAIHCKMETLLGREGAWLDAIYYCPHHPDKGFPGERPELKIHCSCRKPAPGMLLDAAQRFNIDLSRSWMVGDGKNDVLAGKNVGCRTALLCADGTPPELGQERTAPSLYDFVEQVLRGKEGEEKR